MLYVLQGGLTMYKLLASNPSATNNSGVSSSGMLSNINAAFACSNASFTDLPNPIAE